MEDANKNSAAEPAENGTLAALWLRNDTMLGVSQGLGEDLGVNPNYFRILFCGLMFWNVGIAIGAYLGAGVIVAVSRFLFPVAATTVEPVSESAGEASNSDSELQIAA